MKRRTLFVRPRQFLPALPAASAFACRPNSQKRKRTPWNRTGTLAQLRQFRTRKVAAQKKRKQTRSKIYATSKTNQATKAVMELKSTIDVVRLKQSNPGGRSSTIVSLSSTDSVEAETRASTMKTRSSRTIEARLARCESQDR